MPADRRRPPPGALRFNRVVATRFSGRWYAPLWALVEHHGRKSGTRYTTPIAVVTTRGTSLVVGLPWGRRTDWLRNLQAGGGQVTWRGATAAVDGLEFHGLGEVLPLTSGPMRLLLRRSGLTDFVEIHRRPLP